MKYIKQTLKTMRNMKESTWRFTSVCFLAAIVYPVLAIITLVSGDMGRAAVKAAVELARVPQGIIIICAIGSAVIEETATK